MKILDKSNRELQYSDIDFNKGYLKPDVIITKHHDAIVEQQEETHYECCRIGFDDGTSLDISELGNQDPHIRIVDADQALFEYVDQNDGKVCRGIEIQTIIDKPFVPRREAWNETEDIQRYIEYTPSEIEERRLAQEKEQKTEKFLAEGPTALAATAKATSDNSTSIEDINLLIADLIGA